jgi:hypothetical protein
MFTSDSILARVRQQPFRPLRITRGSGVFHDVKFQDMLLVGQSCVMVGASKSGDDIADQVIRVELADISEIRDL